MRKSDCTCRPKAFARSLLVPMLWSAAVGCAADGVTSPGPQLDDRRPVMSADESTTEYGEMLDGIDGGTLLVERHLRSRIWWTPTAHVLKVNAHTKAAVGDGSTTTMQVALEITGGSNGNPTPCSKLEACAIEFTDTPPCGTNIHTKSTHDAYNATHFYPTKEHEHDVSC